VQHMSLSTSNIKSVSGNSKVFPYPLPSVGPGADPSVQAVTPHDFVSHSSTVGCHYFPLLLLLLLLLLLMMMMMMMMLVCYLKAGPAVLDVILMLGRDATVDRLQRALAAVPADKQSDTSPN